MTGDEGRWTLAQPQIVVKVTVEGIEDIKEKLNHLSKEVKALMTDLSGVQAAVENIQTVDTEAAAELQTLATQVANLTAGAVTQQELDAIAAQLNTTAGAVSSAVTAAKGTPPTPPAETPPPVTPPAETPPPVTPPAEETPPPVTPPAEETPPPTGGLHIEQV